MTVYHIWSETYDRQMADIFDIQDDVAQAITEALKLHLTANADRPTENTQAYALYLEAPGLVDSEGKKMTSIRAWRFWTVRLSLIPRLPKPGG